jgi:hypothetical protein
MARELERELARKMGVGPDAVEGAMLNWSVSFAGHAGNLLMTTGSTDQTGNYVFEVMPARVSGAVSLQLPYWNTAHGNDTMYSLWNPGPAVQKVVPTLYSADGADTYAIPVTLAPGAAAAIDVGMLRQQGLADPSGNLLPPEVEDGGAMLEPAAAGKPGKDGVIKVPASGPAKMEVAVSMGIFNAQTATCCTCCTSRCVYTCPAVEDGLGYVGVGQTLAATMTAEDCCGYIEDFTDAATWSDNNGAVLASRGSGAFNALAVGSATLTAEAYLVAGSGTCNGKCRSILAAPTAQAEATPVITCSGSQTGCVPADIWWFNGASPAGYTQSESFSATSGGTTVWAITQTNNELSNGGTGSSSLTVTSANYTAATSPGGTCVNVKVDGIAAANGPVCFNVRAPFKLAPGTPQTSADVSFGYASAIPYTIEDQFGAAMPKSVPLNEEFTTGPSPDYTGTNWDNGTYGHAAPAAGSTTTAASAPAQFHDEIQGQYVVGIDTQPPPSWIPVPVPSAGACPPCSTAVDHWEQTWQVGSLTIGAGMEVQADTIQKYQDGAVHVSITSPTSH